jgi:hypothetical protein
MALHAAERILRRHPEIARDSIYTAVVCGDLEPDNSEQAGIDGGGVHQ